MFSSRNRTPTYSRNWTIKSLCPEPSQSLLCRSCLHNLQGILHLSFPHLFIIQSQCVSKFCQLRRNSRRSASLKGHSSRAWCSAASSRSDTFLCILSVISTATESQAPSPAGVLVLPLCRSDVDHDFEIAVVIRPTTNSYWLMEG